MTFIDEMLTLHINACHLCWVATLVTRFTCVFSSFTSINFQKLQYLSSNTLTIRLNPRHPWWRHSGYITCQSKTVAFSYILILYCLYGWWYCDLNTNKFILHVKKDVMSCTYTWGKNGSLKSFKPLFRSLIFTALVVNFIVVVKNICKLGWQLTTKHKQFHVYKNGVDSPVASKSMAWIFLKRILSVFLSWSFFFLCYLNLNYF